MKIIFTYENVLKCVCDYYSNRNINLEKYENLTKLTINEQIVF